MSENFRKPIVKILMLKGKDGDGKGISSISKTSTSGLVDTYTITLTDGTTSTFTVTNGAKGDKGDTGPQGQQGVKGDTGPQGPQGVKGQDGQSIKEIKKTSTSGLIDTYEISLTDGTKKSFTVSNGKGIESIVKTSTSGLVDTYTITYTDSTTSTFTVKNGKSVGDMDYELTKPKLIVDYTVAEQKMEYKFTTADYPDLAKCKWIYMYVNAPSKPTNQPWCNVSINNSDIYGIVRDKTYNIVKIQKLNGLWSACGMCSDNIAFTDSYDGVDFKWPSKISAAIAYSPIESIALGSYTKCLTENTTIKIYGFY